MSSTPIARVLEPEVMDTAEEAHDYDAMDHAGVNAAFCDDLLAARPSPRWVLDLGTGTARIPLTLCQKCPGVRVVATDLAHHMLRLAEVNVARAGLADRITLRLDDAKAPKPHAEPFDVVASNSVVHHIPEPQHALAVWWEKVPPGALFFVRDLLRPDTEADVLALVERHGGPTPEDASSPLIFSRRPLAAASRPPSLRPSGACSPTEVGSARSSDRASADRAQTANSLGPNNQLAAAAHASHERQLELFRASLRAALRLDEVRDIARSLGIPEGAVTRTSDRHFTLAYERPR